MPHLVRDHLFIGNIQDAAEVLEKGSVDITHVLSLLSSASISFFADWRSGLSISTQEIQKVFVGTTDSPYGSDDELEGSPKKALHPEKLLYSLELAGPELKLVRMAVPLRDMEEEDLLDYLDVCLDFIEKSRKEGSVLVHCFAGVSRRGHKIDSSLFGADPGLPQESNIGEPAQKGTEKTLAYRCKKCRRIVALQENVVGHSPGSGDSCFEWQKRKSGNPFNRSGEPECSSLFVEPLQWMTTVEEGAMEGKLSCVHCDARLGYFNWSGIQCSCGSWITPAFQIHKSRVDASSA